MSDETAVPPQVPEPPKAGKGLSPLAWIAIVVGGLVVLGFVGFLALGVFVFRRGQEVVREATESSESFNELVEELRDTGAEAMIRMNADPDLIEELSTDIEEVSIEAAAAAGAAQGLISIPESDWYLTATSYEGEIGNRYTIVCPPNSGGSHGTVWGSGPYSDDSSIRAAGVHAGVIGFERGGIVGIEIEEGQDGYTGSQRNDVTSDDWGAWGRSITMWSP